MKKWIAGLVGGIGLAGIGTVLAARRLPEEFEPKRSVLSDASAEEIYRILSDLRRYPEWNPWQSLDPSLRHQLYGGAAEVGASYSWNGNKQAGAGQMTIVELESDRLVKIALEFERPFPASNSVEWSISEEGGKRRVTWAMRGRNAKRMPRIFTALFMDMLAGQDFEKGLASLRTLDEAGE